ncbi:unnamed protein product [Phyllotreta striolata]|uniref:Uncharacterized protein n=1 Tax=Phyllotreta striolata TaxID=444603 RepID=A0A9P0DKW3_PHYSR|nr:unnamed protein product [Phyllotreta striolata]
MPAKHRCRVKLPQRMFVHWKSLVLFGLIFWFLLCSFDLLGNPRGFMRDDDYNLIYGTLYQEKAKPKSLDQQLLVVLKNFGFSLLLWNSATFLCSVLFCITVRKLWWMCIKPFSVSRNNQIISTLALVSCCYPRTNFITSKIPIKVRSRIIEPKGSISQVALPKTSQIISHASSPNILNTSKSTNLSDKTKFLNKRSKDVVFAGPPSLQQNVFSFVANSEINKLKEEIVNLEDISMKEQSDLSKRIDKLQKSKKELSKQLATAQHENKVAKQEIQELVEDRDILLKKVDMLNKEMTTNKKCKKLSLDQMEKLATNAENLKKQLQQVTRDKEILEKKLKLLQEAYERLQERFILSDDHLRMNNYANEPERDDADTTKIQSKYSNKRSNNVQSISNPELDLQNIQIKMKQLEKNLENFSSMKNSVNLSALQTDETPSDASQISIDDSNSKSTIDDNENDSDISDFSFSKRITRNFNPYLPSLAARKQNISSRVDFTAPDDGRESDID